MSLKVTATVGGDPTVNVDASVSGEPTVKIKANLIRNNGEGGANGLSAYEIALKNGFEGTEEEWLESLKGKDGLTEEEVKRIIQETAVTKESDPTIPEWAKQKDKPTYKYSEIEGTPNIPSVEGLASEERVEELVNEAKSIAEEAKQTADTLDEIAGSALSLANTSFGYAKEANEFAKEAKDVASTVENRVEKTAEPNQLYGTDADGNPALYPKDSVGTQVKVGGEKVKEFNADEKQNVLPFTSEPSDTNKVVTETELKKEVDLLAEKDASLSEQIETANTENQKKYDKTGGIISGDVTIQGNLSVTGTTTTKDTETLQVKDNVIVANVDGAKVDTENSGFAVKTSTTTAYGIMYDPVGDGVKIGLGYFDENGKFIYEDGQAQFLATRADTITNGNLPQWDNEKKQFVDSGAKIGDYVKFTDYPKTDEAKGVKAGVVCPNELQFSFGNSGRMSLNSNTGALSSRVAMPILGSTMDEAWKMCAINNTAKWEEADWEAFYAFIGAFKDYHNNRNGIPRLDDGKLSLSYPVEDHHAATMKYVKDRVAQKVGETLTEANAYTDSKSLAAFSSANAYTDSKVNAKTTTTSYKGYSEDGICPLKIGGLYMIFASKDCLELHNTDGTKLVTGARQMFFFTVPYSETEKQKFVVMGMYFYTGSFSITNPKMPMEFIQIQVNDGCYVVSSDSTATFTVSERL